MPVGHLYVFFGETSIWVCCQVFDWVVCFLLMSCMRYLSVLEINPLLVASFANIISLPIGCFFYFVYGFFCCEKAFKIN